jgi:hypothetical protein
MHPMGYICDKLQSFIKPSNKQNPLDLDYNNYNNNTININRANNIGSKNIGSKNVLTNNVPILDISNAIISLNGEDIEPPSYREVRDENVVCYKKTMLFNGYSDTLIWRPRI